MEYLRTENDVQFRKIHLKKKYIPSFQPFKAGKVTFSDGEVLEVQHKDGSAQIIEHEVKRNLCYTKLSGKRGFSLPSEIPTEHLWLQDLNGLRYKVPDGIEPVEGRRVVLIPGDLDNAELRGDSYFEAAIDLEFI